MKEFAVEFNDFSFDFSSLSNAENAFEWSTESLYQREQEIQRPIPKTALKNGNSTLTSVMLDNGSDLLTPVQAQDLGFLNVSTMENKDRPSLKRKFADLEEDAAPTLGHDDLTLLLGTDPMSSGFEFVPPTLNNISMHNMWPHKTTSPRVPDSDTKSSSQATTVRHSPLSLTSSRPSTASPFKELLPSKSPKGTYRRQQHQISERKRRANMKNIFDELTELIPALRGHTNHQKITSTKKLDETLLFIQKMKGEQRCIMHEISVLRGQTAQARSDCIRLQNVSGQDKHAPSAEEANTTTSDA